MSEIVWIDHCDMIIQALRANILPFFSTYHVKSCFFVHFVLHGYFDGIDLYCVWVYLIVHILQLE